jgi:acetyl esterase/lipase
VIVIDLAPEIRDLLAWDQALGRRIEGLAIAEQRRVIRAAVAKFVECAGTPVPDIARIDDYDVPVGAENICLRVYTPYGKGTHGAFFHIHGGGFTLGGIDWGINHVKCAHICATVGCVVTTVGYRLAPEFPYPTAIEDCYASLLWLVDNAERFGIDTNCIAIGGESAGGNLAAVLALMARDRGGPRLALQLLEVPVVDMSERALVQPSMTLYGHGFGLDTAVIEAFINAYLPNPAERDTGYASPYRATDLSGLAPAHLITAEFDPLRDAGEAYAARLKEAGVPTTLHRFGGQTHGSSVLWRTWAPAGTWMEELTSTLRNTVQRAMPADPTRGTSRRHPEPC